MELNLYDEFWFKVKIQSAKGVHAVSCVVLYPSEILEAVSDEEGALLVKPGSFFASYSADEVLSAALENRLPGRLQVALNKPFDETPSAGVGSLFEVRFRCVGVGEGEIRFSEPRISDDASQDYASQWTPTQIKVTGVNIVSAEIDVTPRSFEPKELDVTWEIAG